MKEKQPKQPKYSAAKIRRNAHEIGEFTEVLIRCGFTRDELTIVLDMSKRQLPYVTVKPKGL